MSSAAAGMLNPTIPSVNANAMLIRMLAIENFPCRRFLPFVSRGKAEIGSNRVNYLASL
jgi:hypothetical protein